MWAVELSVYWIHRTSKDNKIRKDEFIIIESMHDVSNLS